MKIHQNCHQSSALSAFFTDALNFDSDIIFHFHSIRMKKILCQNCPQHPLLSAILFTDALNFEAFIPFPEFLIR